MPESLLPCAARSSTTIGGPSQVSLEASPRERRKETINTLPDDVLLEIFHFCVNLCGIRTNGWHTLVHVCQRWRSIVFASPRRLNLRLEYRGKRPMSETLNVWPVIPVMLIQPQASRSYVDSCWSNLVGALESEHHSRICKVEFRLIPTSLWERLAAAMQKPFPELTFLEVWVERTVASLPDSFLGGSAPLLRHLGLRNCPVRGIPKLLLSANRLVRLHLWEIPDFGYISPQELGTALSAMSRLETFYLGFQSPLYSESRPRSPLARSVFPALTRLVFKGAQEYLENLMAQIEAPLLEYILMNLRRIPVNHEMTPSSHTQRFHDPTTAIHTPTNS